MNAKRFLAAKVVGAVILTVAAGTAAAADGMARKPDAMVCPMAKPADAPQAATKQPGRTEGKTVTRKTAKDSSPAAAAPSSKSGGRTATKTTSKSDANPTGRSVRKSASAAPAKETAGPRKKTGDSKADVGKNAGVRDGVAGPPVMAAARPRRRAGCPRVAVAVAHGTAPFLSRQSAMGDTSLIRELLRHQGDFMAYLMAMVRDLEAAEEIFQDAAVVVMRHAGDPAAEPIRDFRAWAKEIVRRRALHHLRTAGRSARMAALEPELLEQIDRSFDDDTTDPDERRRELEALSECAARLPDVQRRMVALRYEQKASFDAIGAAVGRTAAAVQRALSRTRRMLHDCVQSRLDRPSGAAP